MNLSYRTFNENVPHVVRKFLLKTRLEQGRLCTLSSW